MTATRLAVLLALAALLVGGFALARTERRPRVAVAALALLAVLWLLALAVSSSDWHDADGWSECWPNCSFVQDATGATLFFAPILVLIGSIFAALVAAKRRRGGASASSF